MKLLRLLGLLLISLPFCASALVPQLLSYQGRVAVGTTNFSGTGRFKFALVNNGGTTTYWSNDGTSNAGSQPAAGVPLTVTNGLYSVLLGDTNLPSMTAIPSTAFNNSDVRLRVWFDGGTNTYQLMTPDQRIAAVGYAMMAATAQTVPDGAITSAKIAAGAVGKDQLGANAVQAGNIAVGAVDNAKLANASVTITAGSGLGGGGSVSLGGGVTLTNAGVTSLSNGGGITVSGTTGAVTLGSNATSANSGSTIVQRDGSGNFSAGTITANLTGNVNGSATTATTATGFSGSLAGEVTGTQGATAIAAATVTGKQLAGFVSGPGTVTASDSILTAINKLDNYAPLASPGFTGTVLMPAGTVTAAPLRLQTGTNLTSPISGAVEFNGTNLFVTNSSAARKTIAFTDTAISASQIAAGTITSAMITDGGIADADIIAAAAIPYSKLSMSGSVVNAAINASAGIAYSKLNLANSVTSNDIVDLTITNADISAGAAIADTKLAPITTAAKVANSATTATNANTPNAIVQRDASGNFSAGTITANLTGNVTAATNFTGSLAGNVTGTQSLTVVGSVGGVTAANVASGANLANAATTAPTANTIVKRDANGNFSAGTITASLTGNAATATTATSVPDGAITFAKLDYVQGAPLSALNVKPLEFVTVGNPGNGADSATGNAYGSVGTQFRIGKYEVTNEQYVEFLNAVAVTDLYGLFDQRMADRWNGGIVQDGYNGKYSYSLKPRMRLKPVVYVTWYSAIRFCNWLHNGKPTTGAQTNATTEDGAYLITGGSSVGPRKAGAAFFLPTENEWYKAAYHKNNGVTANYWTFPTASDTQPTSARFGSTDFPLNSANYYYDDLISGNGINGGYAVSNSDAPVDIIYLTDVGSYPSTASAYGALDMAGNAYEWTETAGPPLPYDTYIVRGGSWSSEQNNVRSSGSQILEPTDIYSEDIGFRVAKPLP